MKINVGGISGIWVARTSQVDVEIAIPDYVPQLYFIDQTAELSVDYKETESSIKIVQNLSCTMAMFPETSFVNDLTSLERLAGLCFFDLIVWVKCFNGQVYKMGTKDVPVRLTIKNETGRKLSDRSDIRLLFECESINLTTYYEQ